MKIKPCPWLGVVEHHGKHPCGLTIVQQNGEPKTGSPVSYAVMCLGCGATGPSAPTRKEAIKAWNQTVREVEGMS